MPTDVRLNLLLNTLARVAIAVDLDPTLQITGEYQVNVAARGALNIGVIVGGTLRRPKLSLMVTTRLLK